MARTTKNIYDFIPKRISFIGPMRQYIPHHKMNVHISSSQHINEGLLECLDVFRQQIPLDTPSSNSKNYYKRSGLETFCIRNKFWYDLELNIDDTTKSGVDTLTYIIRKYTSKEDIITFIQDPDITGWNSKWNPGKSVVEIEIVASGSMRIDNEEDTLIWLYNELDSFSRNIGKVPSVKVAEHIDVGYYISDINEFKEKEDELIAKRSNKKYMLRDYVKFDFWYTIRTTQDDYVYIYKLAEKYLREGKNLILVKEARDVLNTNRNDEIKSKYFELMDKAPSICNEVIAFVSHQEDRILSFMMENMDLNGIC